MPVWLHACLENEGLNWPLREGGVVVVTRLDRLARSTRDLLDIAERPKNGGAGLRSRAELWTDTPSPGGSHGPDGVRRHRRVERSLIGERTTSGRKAAQARSVRFRRQSALTAEQVALGRRLIDEGKSVREVARVILSATLQPCIVNSPEHLRVYPIDWRELSASICFR